MSELDFQRTVNINGADRDILMSFGLQTELVKIMGSVDKLTLLPTDFDLRDKVLASVLADRNKAGKITKPVALDDIEIAPDDAISLIEWASEHVLRFFLKAFNSVKAVSDRNEKELTALTASLGGSEN